jgi:MFS family permease
LGRLLAALAAFEVGNVAATLLILRATELLTPGRGPKAGAVLALGCYTAYNLAATLASVPAGRVADRRGSLRVLAAAGASLAVPAGAPQWPPAVLEHHRHWRPDPTATRSAQVAPGLP